jgi:hypothetical protein
VARRLKSAPRPSDAIIIVDIEFGREVAQTPFLSRDEIQKPAASADEEGRKSLPPTDTFVPMVELHGGSISASSSGLGQGATFIVRLRSLQRPSVGAVAS